MSGKKLGVIIFLLLFVLVAGLVLSQIKSGQNTAPVNKIAEENTPKESVMPVKGCPEGYILVPGSKLYGTSDFCVMKYEAKCAETSSPNVGIEPPPGNSC